LIVAHFFLAFYCALSLISFYSLELVSLIVGFLNFDVLILPARLSILSLSYPSSFFILTWFFCFSSAFGMSLTFSHDLNSLSSLSSLLKSIFIHDCYPSSLSSLCISLFFFILSISISEFFSSDDSNFLTFCCSRKIFYILFDNVVLLCWLKQCPDLEFWILPH